MTASEFLIHPLGDSAATIVLGNSIDRNLNHIALSIAETLRREPFQGFIESSIGMASVTCFYDPIAVRRAFPDHRSAFHYVADHLDEVSSRSHDTALDILEHLIPFRIGPEFSPDLSSIAETFGLTIADVLNIFTAKQYRVYMLGFLPGFAYMGEVDQRIAAPRLSTPRLKVPAGSIAIASEQAGIYPVDSSGGWNIIGRTDVLPFDRSRAEPFLFRPGDTVRFEVL